ncbi:MAG: hypothetical protein HY647_03225 [Acidobacteria bacterium]|nr:hypothetical protein [Acidobacteriota bacterium]
MVVAIATFGFPYYRLSLAQRVGDPLHAMLRPSGSIGLRLGQLGLFLFFLIYLYTIRKRWPWLRKIGNTRHWLNFHMLLGVVAPALITFHSSFKVYGLAGTAFWIMWVVVASGFVGRYFYKQIPRSLNATEMSLNELEKVRAALETRLASQHLFTTDELAPLFRLPSTEAIQKMSLLVAFGRMIATDLSRPFQVSALRRKSMSPWMAIMSLGGLLPSGNRDVEDVIYAIRRQSWLSMKINFLGKAEQVFHLWHVVHRPFSYSLAVLVLLHIATVMLLGYY